MPRTVHNTDSPVQEASEPTTHRERRSQQHGQTPQQYERVERHRPHRMQSEEHKLKNGKLTTSKPKSPRPSHTLVETPPPETDKRKSENAASVSEVSVPPSWRPEGRI